MFSLFIVLKAQLEIPIPHYFLNDVSKAVQEKKAMLMDIFKMMEVTESLDVS